MRAAASGILRRVRVLRFLPLLLCTLALGACQPRNVEFTLRFASASTRTQTAAIRVRILQGDCTGALVYATAFDPSSPDSAATPPRLGPGTYAFEAEARDATCQIIARTCVARELPLETSTLELTLADVTPTPACEASQCDRGVCGDDTPPDSGTPPVPDAGRDTGVVGPDCTSDGMCPGGRCRGGMCCNGCWTGTACVGGSSASECGGAGNDCDACTAEEACRASACVTGPRVTIALSPVTSYARIDGRLWSAGDNASSQRGRLESTTPNVFARQSTTIEFIDVAATQLASCGIDVMGHLHCWGRNAPGLLGLGDGNTSRMEVEPQMVGSERWLDVAAGNAHFCAIRSDGALLCWGTNTDGRLGVPSPSRNVPTEVEAGGTWRMVAPGDTHTCGIRTDGTLHCWGTADDGKLGVAGATSGHAAQEVGGSDWVWVSAGVQHTCGIRGAPGARALHCWGLRNFGVLGDGMTGGAPQETPLSIEDTRDWIAVAAGQFHSCAIAGNRDLYCWGVGSSNGATGLTPPDADTPTRVGGGYDWVAVGWSHTCAISVASGAFMTLRCWGVGTMGMTGLGSTDTQTAPAVAMLVPAP